jgi:hypothetical protein
MKRVILLAAIVVSISAVMPLGHAAATGRTFVDNNCHDVKIQPRYILFACGDGGFYATQLEWDSWHRFRALGRGNFHQNDCDPSCAGGTFHTASGRLLLKDRGRCPGVHHFVFLRAVITFDGSLLGRHRVGTSIMCPL